MATPARGVLRHAADPSRLKRKSSPPPCACLRRPSGTPGGPPAAHKASRRLGGPPRAAGSEATHLSGRSAPSLSGSPSPGCPDTSQSRIPFPPYWETFPSSPRWARTRSHPLPPLFRASPEPHPSDRCVQGTLDEPPGVHRGLQPPPTTQLLEGFRFP